MDTFNSQSNSHHEYHLSASAWERRRLLEEAQQLARQREAEQTRALRRQKLKNTAKSVGKAIQKFNIGKWIDDLEKDQELADDLDRLNAENEEEQQRKEICREAEAACLAAIETHLTSFLDEQPRASYEDWIRELHPDNVHERDGSIDARFFVEDSDHRQLWNANLTSTIAFETSTDGQPVTVTREHVSVRKVER